MDFNTLEAQNTIGLRIRLMRRYYGKTQVQFAKELGINQSTLSAMENDTLDPPFNAILRLGQMGFDLSWILYGKDDNSRVPENKISAVNEKKILHLLKKLDRKQQNYCRKMIELYVDTISEA